jgi:outer membrane immunogenic protein
MKYQVMIATAAAALLATPAHAEGLAGFRLEGRLGWEQVGTNATLPNPDEDEDVDGDELLIASDEASDPSFGVEIGYDVPLGSSFVVGAYAGADLSNSEMCVELVEDDLACNELERTFTVGLRAGVPVAETALLYVKGGYANGKFKTLYNADVTDDEDDDAVANEKFSGTQNGFQLGGGVELGLTRSLYAKLEYVFTDFGSRSHLLADMDDDAPGLELSSDRHQVIAGIGLRF